ncbi:MAG: hypothetical protein IPM21_10320 [Acidobacteria bacterium]|nr:hypothetical protein [Acidobacteriota bacterium]
MIARIDLDHAFHRGLNLIDRLDADGNGAELCQLAEIGTIPEMALGPVWLKPGGDLARRFAAFPNRFLLLFGGRLAEEEVVLRVRPLDLKVSAFGVAYV